MLFVDARCRYRADQVGLQPNPSLTLYISSSTSKDQRQLEAVQFKDGIATLNFAVDVAQERGDWAHESLHGDEGMSCDGVA